MTETHAGRRRLNLENATLIGDGFSSRTYMLEDGETVIKVFVNDTPEEDIAQELRLAKKAFILGVPTAISYDLVEVDDGSLGIVFEFLNSGLLRDAFLRENADFEELMGRYTDLLFKINSTVMEDEFLPDMKVVSFEKLEFIRHRISEEEYRDIHRLLSTIPEAKTLVHGDCHVKNIMLSGDELFLIDMETLGRGHPIFELASLFFVYTMFEWLEPLSNEIFLGLKNDIFFGIQDRIMYAYLGGPDSKAYKTGITKINFLAYVHGMFWYTKYKPENTENFERIRACVRELTPLCENLVISVRYNRTS